VFLARPWPASPHNQRPRSGSRSSPHHQRPWRAGAQARSARLHGGAGAAARGWRGVPGHGAGAGDPVMARPASSPGPSGGAALSPGPTGGRDPYAGAPGLHGPGEGGPCADAAFGLSPGGGALPHRPLADPVNRFEAPLRDPRCHQRRPPPPRSRADRLACQPGVHRRGVHTHGRALQTGRHALQTGRHARRRDCVQIALSCYAQRPRLWRLWSYRQCEALRTRRTTPSFVALERIHPSVHPCRVQCTGWCRPLDAWLENGDPIPMLLQQLRSLADSASASTKTFDNDTVSFKVFGFMDSMDFLLLL
jgi:hypothetical protein